MPPEKLAEEVADFVAACQKRVLGVGKDQYVNADTGRQLFEDMPLADLIDYAAEEIQDLAVYAVMLNIRIRRLRHALTTGIGANMFWDARDMVDDLERPR